MNYTQTELLKRIESNVLGKYQEDERYSVFRERLARHFPDLFGYLFELYGSRFDFLYQVEDLLQGVCRRFIEWSPDPVRINKATETSWRLRNGSAGETGAVFYVDLFAGNLNRVAERIPYLLELGVTFVHLMPVYRTLEGESDGGYAVTSYREVEPRLGTMEDLRNLIDKLEKNGIGIVLDFILNHTSSEHRWAVQARNGNNRYRDFYYIFSNRDEVDEYSGSLRDIFPEVRKGSFSFSNDLNGWVWTTFHDYQWDLNYTNPEVFGEMAAEMLYLAEAGVGILRFDALAFIWKQKGTGCENLPQVHTLIRAFRSLMDIVAPHVLFLSEAIVHPDEISKYISREECELSYNPLYMATIWESLATRKTELLKLSMQNYADIPEGCYWLNYVRCHDDIGWTFSDSNAWQLGIDPSGHRNFLNSFYTGRFKGSFAKGLPFQENPDTGDMRISGTCASLAGLEKALKEETEDEVRLAVSRIIMIHGLVMSMQGFPLIYMGDEAAQLNDYSFTDIPSHSADTRWIHRQKFRPPRKSEKHYSRKVFNGIRKLIFLRKENTCFDGGSVNILDFPNEHLFAFERISSGDDSGRVIVVANFSEEPQEFTLPGSYLDIISGTNFGSKIKSDSYQLLWLKKARI